MDIKEILNIHKDDIMHEIFNYFVFSDKELLEDFDYKRKIKIGGIIYFTQLVMGTFTIENKQFLFYTLKDTYSKVKKSDGLVYRIEVNEIAVVETTDEVIEDIFEDKIKLQTLFKDADDLFIITRLNRTSFCHTKEEITAKKDFNYILDCLPKEQVTYSDYPNNIYYTIKTPII